MATVQLRVDPKTKRAVTHIFQELGLDLSTGVKIYFRQVLREKGIPFLLITENGFTPEQEKKILTESRRTKELYRRGVRRGHTSIKTMVKEIMGV